MVSTGRIAKPANGYRLLGKSLHFPFPLPRAGCANYLANAGYAST
jgi:hypothetical protein